MSSAFELAKREEDLQDALARRVSAQEYEQVYGRWVEAYKPHLHRRAEALLDAAAEIESSAVAGNIDEAHNAHYETTRVSFGQLSQQQRKRIWDECHQQHFQGSRKGRNAGRTKAAGSKADSKHKGIRNSNTCWPSNWTKERIGEWDPNTKAGISGISGLKFRSRNGPVDRGNYAGQAHLMSTAGHNPIAVPGGIKALLARLDILTKYANSIPRKPSKLLFNKRDHFRVQWKRLEDGTRLFVRIV